jgi:hypothetical protein
MLSYFVFKDLRWDREVVASQIADYQFVESQIADIWKILLLQVEILVTVAQGITNVRQTNNTSTSGMNEE